jgi:hypothetical protein
MFWPYFRIAFSKYANFCCHRGKVSQSFSSAAIRLIPKKGDVSQIKNWRPISLLNSCFKIISKAVDNRLKKLTTIVLSRGQKGFTNKRFIHECLINIYNTIEHCEKNKIPAFVLALDMAKAFDTVRHDYAVKVYEFFGIGPFFRNVLTTISTCRTASIILDSGEL